VPRYVDAAQALRQFLWQQRHLHALSETQFFFVARFVGPDPLVETRVLDRDRRF
jgi:hypothetical protein